MAETPKLGFVYVAAGQAGADTAHNDALNTIDVLLSRGVVSRSVATPPVHTDGNGYIIAASATGEWAGFEGHLAMSWGGAWVIIEPKPGWVLWVQDENVVVTYRATAWKSIVGESIFAARITANQNLTTVATGWVPISWGAQDRYNSGTFGHDTGTNPSEITLKEAGDYLVIANVTIERVAATTISAELRLVLNGTLVTGSVRNGWVRSTAGTTLKTITLVALVSASAGDLLELEGSVAVGVDNDIRVAANRGSIVVRRV